MKWIQVGDPIEANAIGRALGKKRSKNTKPLLIGSVKSNIGHAEGCAGIASFAKMTLALSNRILHANMNFTKISEKIPAHTFNIKVNSTHHNLPNPEKSLEKPIIVGVNSFGMV